MTHTCYIGANSGICFQIGNELWVKEYNDGSRKQDGRTYKVNFCPECGFKIPDSKHFKCSFIPPSEPDTRITEFSMALSTAIHQMNHNVELMKAFMSSQNTQNECFMERELEHSREISSLNRRVDALEKENLERIGL